MFQSLLYTTIRAVDSSSYSQKDSVEANNIGRSLAKVLTEHPVMVVRGFKLACRHGIFEEPDLHKMDVPLIGWELTGVPDSGRRLVGWCYC